MGRRRLYFLVAIILVTGCEQEKKGQQSIQLLDCFSSGSFDSNTFVYGYLMFNYNPDGPSTLWPMRCKGSKLLPVFINDKLRRNTYYLVKERLVDSYNPDVAVRVYIEGEIKGYDENYQGRDVQIKRIKILERMKNHLSDPDTPIMTQHRIRE